MLLYSKWLTYETGEYKSADDKYGNPAPYFRKAFEAKKGVKKAELYISALGVYKAYINGEEVSNDYLSPGWVDYRKRLPMVTYDITDKIREKNAVGIILSDGWAVGHLGSNYAFKRCGYIDRVEFTATIKIEYEKGETEEIISDTDWKATSGEILRSDIYMGEYIDHRLSLGDFSSPDYDDSAWDNAEEPVWRFSRNVYLQRVINPRIVVKHVLEGELISKDDGLLLYDFRQNMSGVVSCDIKGKRGTKITFRFGEMLENDKLYRENLRKAECIDTYVLSGEGTEHFRPLFTFHGFRYMDIKIEGEAEISNVLGECMYTDLKAVGEFSCSDEIVNRIYLNALWGQRDNFLDVPTDCPQRDERLGWTGDSQIFSQSAMYNMDCRIFYEKHLADIRDAQFGNGGVPAVAPVPPVGTYGYTGWESPAGWSEAIMTIPMNHYKMYGDKKILEQNLTAAKRLIDYYETDAVGGLRSGDYQYGDWLSVGEPTDLGLVTNLYFAHGAHLTAEMCKILGNFEEEKYRKIYEGLKKAIRKKYIKADGVIANDTQCAYILSYVFGIIDEKSAKKHIKRTLDRDNGHLTTGFLSVKHLLPVLCELGLRDYAYMILTQRDYPSWGYSVVNGATTIWERWDSYTKERGICDDMMNSFNHYSLGSCTEWMYEYCLGIRPDIEKAGFKKLTLKPYFDFSGKITSAKGHYECDFGRIEIEWEENDGVYIYNASVPEEIELIFDFPDMEIIEEMHKGELHSFKLKKD